MHREKSSGQLIAASRSDLYDRDIRIQLHRWLLRKDEHRRSAAIIHEFEIPRPSARADIALINGRISGYEIKGAADTLARLRDQEPSFSSVFERMALVVATRHVARAADAVPNWWEIIETDGASFRIRRRGKANPNLSVENLLHVLTKAELLTLQVGLKFYPKCRSAHKSEMIASILAASKTSAVKQHVRSALKQRPVRPPS